MTKLQLLHRALNERLMAAVEQIMEMVGGTVLEYEEETVRARKENEILRRRLRWMEGENPTDWPDPTDFSIPGETSLTDALAIESLIIKTEPIDSHDFQLYGPDTSLTASVCTASMEMVCPGTSASADAGIPDGIIWDSAQSYMAPLDFDPTPSTMARNRNQRKSFACPDCGKVFGREQRLMFHMRVHSTERPYTYRRRKACFYGDKKQKRKLRGLSKTSREFIEDLSDTSEQTEQSAVSANVRISTSACPSAPELEPSEASDDASEHTSSSSSSSSKLSDTSSSRPAGLKAKQGREKPKTAQCLQCNKAFTNVSRLAVHMKTHQKSFSSQDKQNVQGDTDRGDSGSQHLTKVIRNNETEVEKAKAIGQKLFQCPECTKIFARSCWLSFHLKSHERERKRQKKKQLQNNKLKDTPKLLEKPKKVVAADSKVHVLKKIFACPYCDKVFAREGWLGPHIRSHTNTNHNSDIISDAILPNSTKRSSRRVTKPSRERGNKRKKLAEQSLGTTESSKRVTEKTINETPVSQNSTLELGTNPEIIITNNSDDTSNESQSISSATETFTNKITEESPPVPEESSPDAKEWTPVPEEWTPVPEEWTPVPKESTPVPEESSGQKASDKKAKKRFPCRECGKVYLLAGWLKTHKKMHKNERILEENRRQLLMMKEFGQDSNKETGQSLVKKNVRKKQKKEKTDMGLQGSPDNKKKKKSQLTNAVLLETMDKSSDTEPVSDKSKESGGATSRKCVCKDCGKVYARKNWLSLHMLGHRKALMALPQKANDEKPNSDSQVTQEGSSTEDQKGQKGKDGSKATFPCPFCDKVFPRAMRLMVHMQIHSGEKPYSYRQRKGQFYAEPTRPRVPDTEKQESAIEGNDEQGKDEGGDVTRSQTSPDQTSTAELLETGQPQSVSTGRQFNLLPLQSSDAATIQSMALTRTESKSESNFSLQPRIVLDPVMAEASHSPSSERGDFKPVNVETYDIQLRQTPELESSNAATGGQVKSRLHQTPNPHTSQIPLAEADDPDIVCVTVGSADKYHEHTSCPETLFVSLRDQHSSDCPESNRSEILKEDCRVDSRDLVDGKQHKVCRGPQILEMDIESQPSGSQIYTHGKSRFLGVLKPNNIPPHFEYLKCSVAGAYISDKISTDKALATDPVYESSSSAVQHLAHSESGYMLLSDVSDDDDCADVSNNSDDDKKKEMTNSMPLQEASADARAALGFPHKASDSDVTVMLEKTDEQNVHDGTLANRDELAEMTVQQAEEASSTGQTRWFTCMVCDLTFSCEAILTQHMQVHAVSTGTYPKSNAFKTLKKRVKNNETKPKQEVQTSEVGSAESKDSCEISGNGDPTLRNISTDFGATSRSKTVDRKSTKEKDTQCCCYCEKACGNIELHDHLMHDHPQEPKVMEALNCRNNFEERKRLLSLLCRSKEQKTSRNKTDGDLVRCIFCQGYYRRYHFWKHALICKQKQPEEFTETEPGSNIVLPNTSLKLRHSLAQKCFYPESGNLIKDVFCNTVLQTTAESVKLPSAEAEHYTTHYLCSVSTDLEPGTTNVNPGQGLASPPVLYSNNSSAMMNLDSKSSGPLILDSSWPGAVEKAFAKNQKVTLKTKGLLKNEHQSTIEPENRLHNILQHHTSVSGSSYFLHATCSNLHQDTDKDKDCRRATAQALDYSGEPVTQIHIGGRDSQLSTNVKSDWTIRPTVQVGMEKHLVSNKEPDKIITMPELRSERSTQSNRHSESTGCPVASLSSSKAQDAANKYPEVESRCRLIPSLIPRAKQHDTDSEKQFDSEGHMSDVTEECSTCTGKDSDLKLPGVNSAATIKRRWDSGSGDTKRRRQSDPLQTKGQQLLSDPDSQSNLTTHTSLVGNDDIKQKTSLDWSDDWSKTGISTDDEQDSQNGLSVVNRRRRSSRIHARPMKLTHSPSDEAERTSQRSKPHVCQHCNASFCTPYNLRRHLYTHTSERPFWCSECNMGFIQKYRYRNHRMIHHVTEDLRTFHAE